jgi:hypothetical protein
MNNNITTLMLRNLPKNIKTIDAEANFTILRKTTWML